MTYLFLLGAMTSSALCSIMSSLFGRKSNCAKSTSSLYTIITAISAFLTWGIMYLSDFIFDPRSLLYSFAYGIFYSMAMFGMFKAYQTGSVSLTAFIKQLALIGVAFWGVFFWDTPLTLNICIGIVLIIAALYLCFNTNKDRSQGITLKWLFYSSMLLFGNAFCAITQKYQQMTLGDTYGNQLMFFGIGFSALACTVLHFRKNRCKISDLPNKYVLLYPVIGGVSSALLNLFILLLISSPMPENVFFPGIAVGGLIITMLFSLLVFRERLKLPQWIGLAIGTVALIFLNL